MRLLTFVFFLLSFFPAKAQTNHVERSSKMPSPVYFVGSKSELILLGTTNINSFKCDCKEEFSPQYFYLKKEENKSNIFSFANTKLSIPIVSFDCGNRMMNRDLQAALNAKEFPEIIIELKSVTNNQCSQLRELDGWVKLKTRANISLNGIKNEYWLDITAQKTAEKKYRFIGTKTLNMTDFCVEPPTAMMGMVKVDNEIKISLDLEIRLE